MRGLTSVFVLVALIKVIPAQGPPDIPEKCKRPPSGAGRVQECCKIPSFFSDEEFQGCGFEKISTGPPPPPRGPPDCSREQCLLENKKLLTDDKKIDKKAVEEFMDKWAKENPEWTKAEGIVKEICLNKELPGPPHLCEAVKMLHCSQRVMFEECPKWEESNECKTLIAHLEECKEYFPYYVKREI